MTSITGLWLKFQNFILVGALGVALGIGGSTLVSNTLDFKVPLIGTHVRGTAVQLRAAKIALRDPVTGYKWQDLYVASARDLSTCRTNNTRLEEGITKQNTAVKLQSDKTKAALDAAKRDSQTSKGQLAAAETTFRKLTKNQPAGIDFCARVVNVDEKFVETLK